MKSNMKSNMKPLVLLMATTALIAGCHQQSPQMVQQCGINQATGQQACVLVPIAQATGAYHDGVYYNGGYNPGYNNGHSDAVAAGVIGAAAGFALGHAVANGNNQPQQRTVYVNQQQPANSTQVVQAATAPVSTAPKTFTATSAATTPTSKLPTGGTMAGQSTVVLTAPAVPALTAPKTFTPVAAASPAPKTFSPTPAKSYAPSSPAKMTFSPTSAKKR